MLFITGAREIGGAEVYLLSIVKYLKQRNEKFSFACQYQGPLYERIKDEDIKTIKIELGSGFGKWRGLNIFSPVTIVQFYRFQRQIKPTTIDMDIKVIHVQQDFKEKLFASLFGRIHNLPVAWTEHGMLHPWIKSTPFRYLYRLVANSMATKIICVSDAVRRDLLDTGVGQDKLVVIHNGVAIADDSPSTGNYRRNFGFGDENIVICSTARLFHGKGIQDLIEAVAKLRESCPNIKVLLVGDGRYRPELEKLVDELGMRDVVAFTGFRLDAAKLVSACDIFVSPSFDRAEGLPLRILEAMALSKSVVATDVSGTRECVRDNVNGFLVPPRDVEAMARAISKLAKDRDLRIKLGEAGKRMYLDDFTLQKMCDRTVDLLNGLANDPKYK